MRLAPAASSLSLIAVLLAGPAAHAGGYVAAGFGGGASLGGDLEANFDSTDHDSGRISLGHRSGPVAVEASYYGSGLTGTSSLTSPNDAWTSRTLGVDLKYFFALAGNLDAYGKLGLHKTWLDAPASREHLDFDGRGWDLGAGLQYGFDLDAVPGGIAVWLDYTHQDLGVSDSARPDIPELDGSLGVLSLGVAVGF